MSYPVSNFLDETFPDRVNPYYEKWKPGRPSKAAKEKRAKSDEWTRKYIEDHHGEFPLLTFLSSPQPGNVERVNNREVRITWQPRNLAG